jgi:hypothetical protein
MEAIMANDNPTSLRMGFGYQQAKAAGAPYLAPRPVSTVNFLLNERTAEKEIRALVGRYEFLEPLVREMIEVQKLDGGYSAQEILRTLKLKAEKWENFLASLPKRPPGQSRRKTV